MNTPGYIFLLTGFLVLKALMISGATATIFGSPTLITVDPVEVVCINILHLGIGFTGADAFVHCLTDNFVAVDCGFFDFTCSSIAQATQDIGIAIFDLVILAAVLSILLIDVIIFIAEIGAIIVALAVADIPGAPVYINIMLIGIPVIMLGIQVINMLKPGSKADTE